MAKNKIVFGGNVLIDLTDLDVTAGDVVSGVTFIMNDGTKAVGTITIPTNISDLNNDVGMVTSPSTSAIILKNNVALKGRTADDSNTYNLAYMAPNNRVALGSTAVPTVLQGSNGNANGIIINADGQLSSFVKIVQKDVSVPATNAHTNQAAASYTFTVPTDMIAVGIVGWSSGNFRIRPTTHYVSYSTGTIFAGFANTSASNVTSATTVTFYILCIKATLSA